jgi:AAA domain
MDLSGGQRQFDAVMEQASDGQKCLALDAPIIEKLDGDAREAVRTSVTTGVRSCAVDVEEDEDVLGGRFVAPVSDRWDSAPYGNRNLAIEHLDAAETVVPFRIDGWLAQRGASVWFGAGSTGKTQLLLWMAAVLATRPEDRVDQTWLGGRVHGTGHVLVLTAEDSREQIIGRIVGIVGKTVGLEGEAFRRTCSRIHVMPFLSLTEEEFDHDNPSLFEPQTKERIWRPSQVLLEIRRYIEAWNARHSDPADRIIGVVMDSATSMAGFDSLDALATTNFFFYIGRLSERLRIFWSIIGHTPKSAPVPKNNARATATSRLRGVAMWTTAPRMTVEVRHIQEWGSDPRKTVREEPELRERLPQHFRKEDILVVCVAKANLLGAHREERYLVRSRKGAFVDVTDGNEGLSSEDLVPPSDGEPRPVATSEGSPTAPAAVKKPRAKQAAADCTDYTEGTNLVIDLLRIVYPDLEIGQRISANRLHRELRDSGGASETPAARLVKRPWGGGEEPARPGAVNWHLDRLSEKGLVEVVSPFGKRLYQLTEAGCRDIYLR